MSNVKLTFVGTGSAFAKKNYQNNLLIENCTESLLIDCGSTAFRSLAEMKKNPASIQNIFISHLHADHTGGLEELAFLTYFVFRPMARKRFEELYKKLDTEGKLEEPVLSEYNRLLKNKEDDWKPTIISTINVLNNLWDNSLKGGLNSIQYQLTLMEDYFKTEALVHNDKRHASFSKCGLRFELIRSDHIYIEKKFDVPSYGLIIENPTTKKQILYTGDTKFDYDTFQWPFKSCDTIFHDCQLFDQPASVHATYNELKGLPSEIKAKMWLMHYGDNFEQFDLKKDGFKGFVKQHQEMDFEEV